MMKSPGLDIFKLLLLVFTVFTAEAQLEYKSPSCDSTANYTSGSAYERNLNLTLASLAANASQTGYFETSEGENLDTVYGLIQCRGDISKEVCEACAAAAAVEIRRLCPFKMEAFLGCGPCWLHYSFWRFFSTASNQPTFILFNSQNVSNPVVFHRQLASLLRNLSSKAVLSPSKFDSGIIPYTQFTNISAVVQCTRDLEEDSCQTCLQDITAVIPCCNGPEGGQVFCPSCFLRFEIYSFFQLSSPPPSTPVLRPQSPNSTPTPKSKKKGSENIIIVAISVATGLLLVVMAIICCILFRRKMKTKRAAGDVIVNEEGEKSMESLLIGLTTLKAATENFSDSNKLGKGGFGPVYKGKLRNGKQIAVKRLSSRSGQGVEELKTEVMLVAKMLHRNLVKLLGFCIEEEEKLLVYEYLPNGSLDKILFDESRELSLEWERRYKIIFGIARGLLYLHEDSQLRVIHRDLKASNILLDEHMNPKISDFGLARLFDENQTQANTLRIAGTYGYMAPEYIKKGQFSTKSDVYSFGILVLEIISGRKNSSSCDSINLQSRAWQNWANGTALDLLDPAIDSEYSRDEVIKCIQIGLLCVQEAPVDRPTMSHIITMLSSQTISSPAPSHPAFFVSASGFDSDSRAENSSTTQEGKCNSNPLQQSINEVTISELHGR